MAHKKVLVDLVTGNNKENDVINHTHLFEPNLGVGETDIQRIKILKLNFMFAVSVKILL